MCTYLHNPESDNTVHQSHESLGFQVVQVDPYAGNSDGGGDNMTVQEHFIERMANRRWRLDQEEHKCDGSNETGHDECALHD